MNEYWFAAIFMFSSWMGATIMYILYGYPIKMMVKDTELMNESRKKTN